MAWDILEEYGLVENIDRRIQHFLIIFCSNYYYHSKWHQFSSIICNLMGGVLSTLDIFSCAITCTFPEMVLNIQGQFNRRLFSSEQLPIFFTYVNRRDLDRPSTCISASRSMRFALLRVEGFVWGKKLTPERMHYCSKLSEFCTTANKQSRRIWLNPDPTSHYNTGSLRQKFKGHSFSEPAGARGERCPIRGNLRLERP